MNSREDVLMQIWRDYYDEILEVNLDKGTFESQISTDPQKNRKGYLYIETRIVARKSIHPDDREDFLRFFDPQKILDDMKKDIFVSKLNFRMHKGDNEYFWVKVKGIMPSRRISEDTTFFACFRVLDPSSEEDYGYMQRISTELMHEKELSTNRMALMNQYADEIRDPLDGILGMTKIAKKSFDNSEKLSDSLKTIDEECKKIDLLLDEMIIQIGGKEAAPIIKSVDMIAGRMGKSSVMQRKHSDDDYLPDITEDNAVSDTADISEEFLHDEDNVPNQTIIPKIEDFDFSGINFLAYVDNELGAHVMREMIESVGGTPYVFTYGQSAVKNYIANESGKFGVVLLDSIDDDFDIGSAARCIRFSCKDDAAAIPIIAITDKTNVSATRNIDGAAINAVFQKPIDFGLLFLKVQELLKS